MLVEQLRSELVVQLEDWEIPFYPADDGQWLTSGSYSLWRKTSQIDNHCQSIKLSLRSSDGTVSSGRC